MMTTERLHCARVSVQAAARIVCVTFALVAVGCTQIVSVKQTRPRLAVHGGAGARAINAAAAIAKEAPLTGLGEYLDLARDASEVLRRNPQDPEARATYNFAVGRSIGIIEREGLNPWDRQLDVPSLDGQYRLTGRLLRGPEQHPLNYRLIPADTVSIGGVYFETRAKVEGIGAPVVAISRGETSDYRDSFRLKRVYASLTAVIRFSGRNAELELIQPFQTEQVTLNGHMYSVAADFSAPIAMLMARERPQRFGLVRLLRPERYRDTATLARLQPYDASRTPIIFIHGLQDTSVTWVPMLGALLDDQDIRERYQFWIFSYPSGYPYSYTAALLRKELDAVAEAFPGHKRIILIGHSMGGLVARLMVTDSGDRIWRAAFGASPGATSSAGRSRRLAEQSLIFRHRSEVQRVVFISTPHRGSELASNWIGRLAAKLVKMPTFLADIRDVVLAIASNDRAALLLQTTPNSINTLSPNHWFLREVNELPITRGVPYHSIIGDRGRGDTPDSSDGVVPYSSSHLEGAESEAIVPSDHRAQQHPQGIAETHRILERHR